MTGPRPHLLYVAWGFPPCRGGGVYRALATANAFIVAGWDVTVITAPREFFLEVTGADIALEGRIDPRIKIVRVPFSRPALETDRTKFSVLRRALPRVWWRYRKLADQVPFPEPGYGPWRAGILAAAEEVNDKHGVDLVLVTANPSVSFAVAGRLFRRFGIPYVLDYRDAWSLDVFSGRRIHGARSRVGRLERRLIARASEIWFVNEPIRSWHRGVYSEAADRMYVVANGWDDRPLPQPPDLAKPPLVFGYLGTISRQVPITNLLAGWRAARAADQLLADAQLELRGYLGFYGSADPGLAAELAAAVADGVSFGGPVAKAEVGQCYGQWDVLLLVLGTGRYVTSGKVFEYLATGLPVVSVHDPGNAASEVLADYPRWYPSASLGEAEIASALSAAAEGACRADSGPIEEAWAAAERFQRQLQLQPRIAILSKVVARGLGNPPREVVL